MPAVPMVHGACTSALALWAASVSPSASLFGACEVDKDMMVNKLIIYFLGSRGDSASGERVIPTQETNKNYLHGF
ncbi:MAG: hypothetical protein ACUZ77_08190 [Candidatus Brocadiales bacterium]